jgi:putative ribosome biogenesis GTPase RsgA
MGRHRNFAPPLPRVSGYRCEFNDCTHANEPGCGVRQAVERGEIAKERYETYLFWLDATRRREGEEAPS